MKNIYDDDSFFTEPLDPSKEGRKIAVEAMGVLALWLCDTSNLVDRGLRTTVFLYCVRPDLIDGLTLRQIGKLAGRRKQHVHDLVDSFRQVTGFQS